MSEAVTAAQAAVYVWFWLLIGYAIVFGCLCGNLARAKGHDYGSGFLTGFLLGVFGLIYYAGLPDARANAWYSNEMALLAMERQKASEAKVAERVLLSPEAWEQRKREQWAADSAGAVEWER